MEFDVLLPAGSPPPAPDAIPAREAEVAADGAPGIDPRVVTMVNECWRHAKVVGAWGEGIGVLEATGCAGLPGIVTGADAADVFAEVQGLMASHRVWERFPATVG